MNVGQQCGNESEGEQRSFSGISSDGSEPVPGIIQKKHIPATPKRIKASETVVNFHIPDPDSPSHQRTDPGA